MYLAEVHQLIEPHLQNQKVAWQQEGSLLPLWSYGTADHLRQVFLNLSMNAIEAMQPLGGNLTIAMHADLLAGQAVVAIKDTGCGIPTDNLQTIFDPFFTTKERGSGLGLSIVYEILERHSGSISVESQANQGTTFTVLLPLTIPR